MSEKPAAIVFLAGRQLVRFTGDGASVPQQAMLISVREGVLEEFLGAPLVADMLACGLPVLAVLEDARDAAQLVRQIRLRKYGAASAELVDDDDADRYPHAPTAPAAQPLDFSKPALARQRAINRMSHVLDCFWRFSVDMRLGEFPEPMQEAAGALVDDLAAIFEKMEELPLGKPWADLAADMLRPDALPPLFAKLGEATAAIVTEANEAC